MEGGGDFNDPSPLLQTGLILESLGNFEEAAVRFAYGYVIRGCIALAGDGVAIMPLM